MLTSFQKIASNFSCLLLLLYFNTSFAQTVNLKDFEKMPSVKSAKEYLAKKDFVVKQDSSSGKDIIKLKLVNKASHEIVHLSLIKGSEGDKMFELDYFTESQEEYAKIVHTIVKSGYNPKNDDRHYEKRPGSYEVHNLVLKGPVTVNGWDYYCIKYSYYAGKELAVPAPPAKE